MNRLLVVVVLAIALALSCAPAAVAEEGPRGIVVFGAEEAFGAAVPIWHFGTPIEVKPSSWADLFIAAGANARVDVIITSNVRPGVSTDLWTDLFGFVDAGVMANPSAGEWLRPYMGAEAYAAFRALGQPATLSFKAMPGTHGCDYQALVRIEVPL
jgi:hypothetical protein